MLCALCRWMISRAEDAGKKPPRWAGRHIRRCGACGRFARASESLSSRLRGERSAWLAEIPDFPAGRELDFETEPAGRGAAGSGLRKARRSWLALRPLPAAAAALILVAAGLVLFQVGRRDARPSDKDRASARAAIKRLTSAPENIQGVIGEAESSLEKERRILESSISSAAEYVQARLNIRIERRDPPAKPS